MGVAQEDCRAISREMELMRGDPLQFLLSGAAYNMGICTAKTPVYTSGCCQHLRLTFRKKRRGELVFQCQSRSPFRRVCSLIASNTAIEEGNDTIAKGNAPVFPLEIGKSKYGKGGSVFCESDKKLEERTTSYHFGDSSSLIKGYRIVCYFQQLGISAQVLRRCLKHANELSEDDVMKLMSTFRSLGLKRGDLKALLSRRSSLLRVQPEQVQHMFRYFLSLGLKNANLIRICVQRPALIDSDLGNIREIICYLTLLGIRKEAFPTMFSRRPQILECNLERLRYMVGLLVQAGVSQTELVTLLQRVPEIFFPSGQDNLQVNLDFWISVGVEGKALCRALIRRPNLLSYDTENLKITYSFLQGLMRSGELRKLVRKYAEILAFDSRRKLEPLIMYLLELGVKDKDIGKIILRRPQLFAYTISGLEKTVIYLNSLGVKKKMLGKVITMSPQVLTLNAEEKLKQGVDFFRSIGLDKEMDMGTVSVIP
eukprot:c27431_g1_i3 orf=236-1684(+)